MGREIIFRLGTGRNLQDATTLFADLEVLLRLIALWKPYGNTGTNPLCSAGRNY